MKKILIFSIIFLFLSILCFIYAGINGEAQVGLFIIFPYIFGHGLYTTLGAIFFLLFIFTFFFSIVKMSLDAFSPTSAESVHVQKQVDVDGVLLIGPFPVIFSTKKSHIIYLAVAAILLCIFVLVVMFMLALGSK